MVGSEGVEVEVIEREGERENSSERFSLGLQEGEQFIRCVK